MMLGEKGGGYCLLPCKGWSRGLLLPPKEDRFFHMCAERCMGERKEMAC